MTLRQVIGRIHRRIAEPIVRFGPSAGSSKPEQYCWDRELPQAETAANGCKAYDKSFKHSARIDPICRLNQLRPDWQRVGDSGFARPGRDSETSLSEFTH